MDRKGSPIWELCKNVAHILTEKLKWTPGNSKAIKIWTDYYASVSPVLVQEFPHLMQRLEGMNIHTLYDLSDWVSNGRWYGWIDLEIDQLNADYNSLITVFPTPVHCMMKDERCWGRTGSYSVKEGYK